MRLGFLCAAALSLLLPLVGTGRLRADELPPKYRPVVNRGLDWIAKQQAADGHWAGNGGMFPAAITSLCGMALLMEGSTIREGKYADNIRKAVDWLMEGSQSDGLLGGLTHPTDAATP